MEYFLIFIFSFIMGFGLGLKDGCQACKRLPVNQGPPPRK